jgi:hypothetical protein
LGRSGDTGSKMMTIPAIDGIYIITVRRIILGDELIYQYGFLIW